MKLDKKLIMSGGIQMEKKYKLLAINPGSTSTKIAVFENENEIFSLNIAHDLEKLAKYTEVVDQLPYREKLILDELDKADIKLKSIDFFVGRGGGIMPCESGTYLIEPLLLNHSREGIAAKHPANLGAVIAHKFSNEYEKSAYVVNPPCVDEFQPVARISGLKNVERKSKFHALNQKEVAIRVAKKLGKLYTQSNFIVAHIGGGISVSAHRKGKVVDSTNTIDGDGAMSPTRCGQVDLSAIIKMAFSGQYTEKEMGDWLTKSSGIVQYLGTNDIREVNKMIEKGNEEAKLIYDAMIYQIGKDIGAYASVLEGDVDAIILTGGIAYDEYLVEKLKKMIGYIAQVITIPGELEMEGLVNGVLRVINGEEEVKHYKG